MDIFNNRTYKNLFMFFALGLLIFLIIHFAPGIFLGAVFAYVLNSFVKIIRDKGIRKPIFIAMIIIIFLVSFTLCVHAILPFLIFEIQEILRIAPRFIANCLEFIIGEHSIEKVSEYNLVYQKLYEAFLSGDFNTVLRVIKPISSFAAGKFSYLTNMVFSFIYFLSTFFISILVFFIHRKIIYNFIFACVPVNFRNVLERQELVFNELFRVFLFKQIQSAAMNAIFFFLLIKILGIPYALSISVLTFFGSMAPYFGSLIGTISAYSILIFLGVNVHVFFSMAIVFLFSYLMENYILVPNFIGNNIGIHPLIIIGFMPVAVKIFGIAGAFFTVPIILIIRLSLQYFFESHAVYSLKKTNYDI